MDLAHAPQKQPASLDLAMQSAAVPQLDAAPAAGREEAQKDAGAAAILRMAETSVHSAWNHVHDLMLNGAGEAVGYAEMLGLRYPVKSYESRVSDGLIRGSRVDLAGMQHLKSEGVKGIVNLCAENNDDQKIAEQLGITPHHIPILDNTAPTRAQMDDFIAFATSTTPCYVHCEAGQGRTGTAVACYRMAVEGWSAERAIAEAQQFGMKIPAQIRFLQEFGASQKAAEPPASPSVATDIDDPPARKK